MKKMLSLLVILAFVLTAVPVLAAPTQNIPQIASSNPDFSILVAALQKANLVSALQGAGPFTVFAPTNAAFNKLLASLNISAEQLLAQPDLSKVLLHHVVSGKVMSADLKNGMEATTLNGDKVPFNLSVTPPMVHNAKITAVDIEATNGVIHVIDTVMIPANFTLRDVDVTPDNPKTGDIQTYFIGGLILLGAALLVVDRRLKLMKKSE